MRASAFFALTLVSVACGRSELDWAAGDDSVVDSARCTGTWGFAPQVTYAAGSYAASVVTGDFNGDGLPDLAVLDETNSVGIFFNAGHGTFAPPVIYNYDEWQPYNTFEGPYSLGTGDFNGDGSPDLAIANYVGTVLIVLNAGNGVLRVANGPYVDVLNTATYPSSSNVGDMPPIAVGDFNGDGLPDLAVVSEITNTVYVLLNAGNATFGAPVAYAVGGEPVSVAVGDFNGDGLPDLALANFSDGTVSVLLNAGQGTFAPQVTYPAGGQLASVVVGDFNGDGLPDFAVANSGSNNVSVMLNTGNGAFDAQVTYAVGTGPNGVAVGDFNGDGHLDLVVTNMESANVSVIFNAGDGTFAPQRTFGVGGRPQTVAVGDFNGDGRPDLAVGNDADNTVSVLLSVCR